MSGTAIRAQQAAPGWPRWWRWTLLAVSTLILCSCSAPRGQMAAAPGAAPSSQVALAQTAVAQAAVARQPAQHAAADSVAQRLPGAPLAEKIDRTQGQVVLASAQEEVVPPPAPVQGPPVAETPLSQLANPTAQPLPIVPCGGCACCQTPRPMQACGNQWRPPGIGCPWPRDEYLCDGGDQEIPVTVGNDWSVEGLEAEDTIAHYDTLDGRRLVEPSNKVCIYAPRFAAVRTVTNLNANTEYSGPVGVESPVHLARQDEVLTPTTTLQNLMPLRQNGLGRAGAYQTRQGDGILATTVKVRGLQDAFLPYENLQIIRQGIFRQAEEARLAEAHDAAITWSHDQAVQVIIDEQAATEVVADKSVEEIYTIDTPTKARLRLIKIASTDTAAPGDIVDFTIRFDNVGCSAIGNVTIIDNLTTRLEYVPDSAQSSLESAFFTELNNADSLTLRWEIDEPLEPGEGGLVRFRCRVR